MKRALPAVPLVLFLFVYACVPSPSILITDEMGTAVALTQTAMAWTPTFTPTPSRFDSLLFVNTLKYSLPEDIHLKNAQELENTIGARYEIADARIVPENNYPSRILEVQISCFCNARSKDCCSPERAFAIFMRRMEYHQHNNTNGSLLGMVPGTVLKVKVYCLDHANRVGIMASNWSDVVEYLNGTINATQFGNRTWPE